MSTVDTPARPMKRAGTIDPKRLDPHHCHHNSEDGMDFPVSVVIPTYNRPIELAQTVRSVLGQVDVEVEIVIVDDGDSRGALGPVQEDPRVRVVVTPQPGSGEGAARNAGLETVAAAWVAFCDDDDLWHPRKLATQLATADGADWMTCGSAAFWV
ncbi:MAG TPA: glycosyltransferase, partial [Acidimicrobiales bacterium]